LLIKYVATDREELPVTDELPAIAPLTPADPDRVGPYRLAGRLGAGGMGVVYAATGAGGRRVAVKVVRPELAHDAEFRTRFLREVSLSQRVQGRCVARVMAADPDGPVPWLATEYIPGPTLEHRIDRFGPMRGDELHGLATGLAEALVALHSQDVVHRDLKPSNLILAPDGPRVVDFGIARALDETALTRTGILMGSLGWISPENYRDAPIGPPADVWAWALIVYYAATGRRPYRPARPEVVAARVLSATIDTSGVPEPYRPLVDRALAKDPRDRPRAHELLTGLTAPQHRADPVAAATDFLDRTWTQPHRPEDPAWERARRRTAKRRSYVLGGAVAAALLVIAVVAGALVYLPSHTGSASAGGPPSHSATPSPTALTGSRITNDAGLSYIVPTGWESSQATTSDTGVCLTPQQFKDATCMHGGVSVQAWAKGENADYDSPRGWAVSGDAGGLTGCLPDPNVDVAKAITTDGVAYRGKRSVGGRPAIYREYRLQCRNGWHSTPRLWWLPQAGVLVETVELPDGYRPTVDAIVQSFDLSGYQRPDRQNS
jgi:eukaryotic-like serine/threonine-protein kinase